MQATSSLVQKKAGDFEYLAFQNKSDIPSPWSNDPSALQAVSSMLDLNELSSKNITKPLGVLFHTKEDLYLFQSGTNCYLWNPIAWILDQVTQPKEISDVLKKLKEKEGLKALKRSEIVLPD